MPDITLTFADGTQHVYKDAPDTLKPEDVYARAVKDFPNQSVKNIARGGGAASAPALEEPARGTVGDYAGAIGSGVMALNKNLASLPAGVLRGVTDVTDTATLLGARGLDYLVPRGQVPDANAPRGPSKRTGLNMIMPSAPVVVPEAPETTREEDIQASIDRRKAQYNEMWGDQAPADVGRLGGQIVATLPIGGAVAAPLKAAANMAPSLAKFLTPVARSLETGGFQTGTTGAANVAAKAVGGGVTGGLAAEAVEPGTGETGALIGAAVPTIAAPAVKGAYNYATRVMDPKTNQLLNWFEGKGKDVLNTLRRPDATIVPGTEPHLGEVASSVGGAKLAAGIADVRSTPAFATERAAQEAQTNQARLAQEARVQGVAEAAKQKKIDALTRRIDSGLVTENPDAIGAGLKEIAKAEKNAIKPRIKQAYDDAFAVAPDAKVDIENVIKKAEDILGQPLADINVPDQPDIVKKLLKLRGKPTEEFVPLGERGGYTQPGANAPSVATLEELDALRKAINKDIASADVANASPAQATKLRELRQLHEAIDDAVGSSTTLPDEAKTAYAKAVDLYRTEYAPRFKEGVNAQVTAKGAWSEDKIRAEDVIKKYFTPGGATEAKQFVNLFGGNADATKIARSGIEDLYRQRVTDAEGIVDSSKHAAFMKEFARPLAILDDAGMGLKNKFAQIGDDAKRLEEVQKLATASGNKLAPPLPQGTNAIAVQKRIDELTSKLNPAQLTAVNAVRDDLARAAEYQRLAAAGAGGKQDLVSGAAEIPGMGVATSAIPGKGRLAASTVGYIFKKLTGAMDDKLALELARELSNPVLAEQTVAKALQTQASREARNALFSRYGARPAGIAASQMRSNPNAEQ
jgi:hypothetical protein